MNHSSNLGRERLTNDIMGLVWQRHTLEKPSCMDGHKNRAAEVTCCIVSDFQSNEDKQTLRSSYFFRVTLLVSAV